MTNHRDSDVLGRYVGAPAAPVQGEETAEDRIRGFQALAQHDRAELKACYQRIDELTAALKDARAFMEGVMQERGDSGVSILIKAADAALDPFPAESGA